MMLGFGGWAWGEDHRQLCRVVEAQTLWGEMLPRLILRVEVAA